LPRFRALLARANRCTLISAPLQSDFDCQALAGIKNRYRKQQSGTAGIFPLDYLRV